VGLLVTIAEIEEGVVSQHPAPGEVESHPPVLVTEVTV